MKKKGIIICAVLILVAAVYFIFSGYEKKYEIESITFIDEPSFVLSDMVAAIETADNHGSERLEVQLFDSPAYRYSVKFTNGRVFDKWVRDDGKTVELSTATEGKFYEWEDSFYISSHLIYSEYMAALEKGEKEVPLHFHMERLVSSNNSYVITKDYVVNIKMPTGTVDSLKIISGKPAPLYEDADYTDIRDVTFEIKYADGTVKKVKPEMDIKDGETSYTLDGKPLHVHFDSLNEYMQFVFVDAYLEISVRVMPCPIEDIEILDYDVNGLGVIKQVKYKLKMKDGTEIEDEIVGKDHSLRKITQEPFGFVIDAYTDYDYEDDIDDSDLNGEDDGELQPIEPFPSDSLYLYLDCSADAISDKVMLD